ncbi:MAG: hypothetical protein H0X47_01015 [Nitrospirales bacterium]|nr:hypothetical protein [Nitrospirales bacterium]
MSNSDESRFGYTVFAGGDRNFLRSVSIPLVEILDNYLESDESATFTEDLPDYLAIDSRPAAEAAILIGGVVGVFAFFASWLATKILDDIYEAKLQPAIRRALGTADQKLEETNSRKAKMLLLGISYAEKRVFILICIVGETFVEILNSEHMIKMVHRNAVVWIENNSFSEPIHLYIVNHGNVNLEPLRFDSLALAHRHIRSMGSDLL